MLPATKAVPKELLPILERPALQLIVDEALGAGVDHLVIVTSRAKPAIEQYFASSPEVEASLEKQGRGALAEQLRRYGKDVRISFAYQDAPRGLGHAVACAREFVGSEPFFVMLPDELMQDSSLLTDLATLTQNTGVGAVALKRMPREDLFRYGIVTPIEKPHVDDAPSDLAIIGRYALTPDIFDVLDGLVPAGTGEIQLTDALSRQSEKTPLHGVISHIGRRDIGNPLGWIEAVIEAGLEHAEFGDGLRTWLRTVI
jgi:UTP--glucose-1-phosphate uridylyltransferase